MAKNLEPKFTGKKGAKNYQNGIRHEGKEILIKKKHYQQEN